MAAGKVYLSPIIDTFDGMPVSWTIRKSSTAEMANTMLEDACRTLADREAPVIHSDREGATIDGPNGSGFVMTTALCPPCRRRDARLTTRPWRGSSGGLRASFLRQGLDGVGIDEFMSMLDEYMRYYRDARIKESLGWKSPKQYRKLLGLAT